MAKPEVIIIGAGFTGCATAHDLALRGFQVTVVERGEFVSGTSGRTHGLLHSGGRYCVNDQASAVECIEENTILRRIVPQCIEPNGGLFIALNESDLDYAPTFIKGAEECHIQVDEVPVDLVKKMEPNLNPKLRAAYLVPDGTFEPFRLAMAFAATAKSNKAIFKTYSEVKGLVKDSRGKIVGVRIWDRNSGCETIVHGDLVINCTGAWAGSIAAMAGVNVPVLPTPGVMVAFEGRFSDRVINRLNIPDDGDISLPQRRMAVVGTTSYEVEDVDYVPVVAGQVQMMIDRGSELIPALCTARMRGAFMSSRPLIGAGLSARSIARTFKCFDHAESDMVDGLITITGGKATTCRAMAEKTADMACAKLGIHVECATKDTPLLSYREFYN